MLAEGRPAPRSTGVEWEPSPEQRELDALDSSARSITRDPYGKEIVPYGKSHDQVGDRFSACRESRHQQEAGNPVPPGASRAGLSPGKEYVRDSGHRQARAGRKSGARD